MAVATSVASVRPATASAPYLSVNNIEVIYDHVILVLKGVSLAVPEQSARARKAAGTAWPPPSCINQKRPSPRMLTGG
jgi:hypothetical protein